RAPGLGVATPAQRELERALAAEVADAGLVEFLEGRRCSDGCERVRCESLGVHRATVPRPTNVLPLREAHRRPYADAVLEAPSPYDAIARLYDPWSRSVTEDIPFYVAEARRSGSGRVVELGVGTGRIAVPIACDGTTVVGVDHSPGMLEICRERAELAGVSNLLDLRLGDFREP